MYLSETALLNKIVISYQGIKNNHSISSYSQDSSNSWPVVPNLHVNSRLSLINSKNLRFSLLSVRNDF